jgi:3-deoxy-D-manno-octulosonic acid (KDO) 8-phosphate synthase
MVAPKTGDALNKQVSAAAIVSAGPVRFGNDLPISIIAGPCALESRATNDIATQIDLITFVFIGIRYY